MATNPKLEFYRFKLNHKKDNDKTFKEFAIDELGGAKSITNEKAVELCFKHFIKSLGSDIAKDDRLKKKLGLEKKKSINSHLDKQPAFDSAQSLIYGVINGGPYGRERIISNNDDENDSEKLGLNKSVLLYFYFFLYVPADHSEGCFIIHSNNSEETITVLFRNFIANMFKGKNYNKSVPEAFCPKSFQDEFKKGAILKSMIFKTSFVDTIHATDAVTNQFKAYDIKIEAIPHKKDILVKEAAKFKEFLSKKLFGTKQKGKLIQQFEETKLNTGNDLTKGTKVFEWNTRENEFVPVVYLEGRLEKANADGTPDFKELGELCLNLFNYEILKSIRPDLNATKIK